MTESLRALAQSSGFQNFVTFVILVAGVLAGVETYPEVVEAYDGLLHLLDRTILAIFVLEIVVKMGAEGSQPWRYFRDPWNVFDFGIVAVALLPFEAEGVAVLRLARLLRVLKLVRALPRLQVLVTALLKSIPSMGYVSLLLALAFYLYGVAGTHLFGANDPVHFGRLEISLLSLFRIVTLEGWTEILYIQMYGCAEYGYEAWADQCVANNPMPLTANAYFISFILIGTMVIMNLFVGVIMNGMEEAHEEQLAALRAAEQTQPETVETELRELQLRIEQARDQLVKLDQLLRRESRGRDAAG
ncbi:MAG: ion transporter [Myxococcota bacterium]